MLELLISIVIVGLIVWAVNAYTPIPQGFKTLILVIGVIFCIIMALHAFGISLPALRN